MAMRQLVLFLHLAAAVFWIGDMFVIAFVVGPYARTLAPPTRAALYREIGRRSLPLAWAAIAILIATGIGNLLYLGIAPSVLLTPTFYHSTFGAFLGAKLLAVLAMLVVSAWHDFFLTRRRAALAKRLTEAPDDATLAEERARQERLARRLGQLNLILALLVLFLAAGLVTQT
jgi:putative copper resistance protein D